MTRDQENSMSGIKVLYVTRTGHARALAEELSARCGGEAAEIGDPANRKGFLSFIKAGARASRGAASAFVDPGIDLSKASAVALVQPIWASAVCPPLRSWLKAHGEELRGKRIGLLLTAKATDGEVVRGKFEKEFGPLVAFATVYEKDGEASRMRSLEKFADALK
jgi:hypothetical protein